MVVVCGFNHKTAPLSVRETCVFQQDLLHAPLRELIDSGEHQEAAILSTCNRTEIYCQGGDPKNIIDWMQTRHQSTLTPYTYTYQSDDAVRHLLRVASGLDSLILGEPQILGQLKQAYHRAQQAGTVGKSLNRLFQYTFAVTKQVRTCTGIGQHPISIAYAAVQLAKQIVNDITKSRILLVGAGDTIELVARYLQNLHVTDLTIGNRDVIKASRLAKRFAGEGTCLGAIPHHLTQADVVITATNAGKPLITSNQLITARRQTTSPLLLIDLALPRNIAADCADLPNIMLHTIDSLTDVVARNVAERQGAAKQADALIELHANAFMATLRSLDAVVTVRAYRDHATQLCDTLLTQARSQLANGVDPNAVLTELTRRLRNTLTHAPTTLINELAEQGDWEMLDVLQHCFGLDITT